MSSEILSQRIAERFADTKRKKRLHVFAIIFGLSPNLGLGESVSARLIEKVTHCLY